MSLFGPMLAPGLAVLSMMTVFSFRKTGMKQRQNVIETFLELRAARLGFRELVDPGLTVQPFLDNMAACAYIWKKRGTRSQTLCTESLRLWREACQRRVTVRLPYWLASEENAQAKILSWYRL